MSSPLADLFRSLPAGFVTVWVLATPYFNRSTGCTTGQTIGLAVITGVLGVLCWIRATTSLYSYRCIRRHCSRGVLWFLYAVFEGAAVTALYAAVTVLTPPGSTCFLYDDNYRSKVSTFTTYNILTASTLIGLAAPRLLDWLQCIAELFGFKVRKDADNYACLQAPPTTPSSSKGVGQSANTSIPSHTRSSSNHAVPQGGPGQGGPGMLRCVFDNDQVEWFIWQLLPCGSVLLYQVTTAYYAKFSPLDLAQGACGDQDRAWLIVLIAVIGLVGFFLTLSSYEMRYGQGYGSLQGGCPSTVEASLFRTRGVAYKLFALTASVCTTATFVAAALLTPPAGPCLFQQQYQDGFLQLLGTCLLPSVAALCIVMGFGRFMVERKRTVAYATPGVRAPPLLGGTPSVVHPSAPPAPSGMQFLSSV